MGKEEEEYQETEPSSSEEKEDEEDDTESEEEDEEEPEKWKKDYSSRHRVLFVGEGDFSFSLCLARAFGSARNMVATTIDTQGYWLPIGFIILTC